MLQSAERQLLDSGIEDSARLDAEVVLAHVLQKDRSYLYAWPETEVTDEQRARFQLLIRERMAGKPIAYITGVQEFWSLSLKVTSATLIPRPETEDMVSCVLEHYANNTILKLLDAGTGTGAIAIALASERPGWQISACDISSEALLVAEENIRKYAVKVHCFQADWLAGLAENSLDVIVSNPPYIDKSDEHLEALAYEPYSALVADKQGLSDIEKIANQAAKVLRSRGALYIEHGYEQAEAVHRVFSAAGFNNIVCQKDLAGNDRFTYGVLL